MRLLPFLAVAALALFARSLPRGAPRAWFVGLLATSALLTFYAAEARAYALLALFDLALFLLLRRPGMGWPRAAAIAACTAAALATHSLAALFVAAVGLIALLERRWRDAAAVAAGGVLFLPWAPVLLRQPPESTAWIHEPFGWSVAGFLSAFGGVGRIPPAFGPPAPSILFWAGVSVGTVSTVTLAAAARRDPELRAALAATALPLAAALAASPLRPIAFAGRTEMAVLPVWIWAVARGAAQGRLARAAASSAAVLGALALAVTVPVPRPEPSPQRVTTALEALVRPADLVVAGTAFYLPARLARDRGALRAPLAALPRELERHPGWFPLAPLSPEGYAELAATLAGRPGSSRVWLMIHPLFATQRLSDVLEARGDAREVLRTPDAVVLLWVAR